ncbi:RING-TYPE E3 UBIQUITIN TRANSFERASE [Salix purpurea]|uniref:RING-type E3 ubiquitin transferase n=1 Tax=Salix purpurea TaxID=77065 RepID=A0A9Q0TJU6_SALPP|nr:RING-TYPE E3 UBIQUITIN TRANSFERASE [Salix purpurea]KAJ6712898.1 RING-TYPE E3 UBIQUITIN TRANSFERASE [Salix purpurea]KAJ6712899.1 RING-TYPE E3 UBIQUITIN TRANSFERASE [Salix purpurea]
MDFNIGIEDVGVAVLQELWNKVAFQAMEIVTETRDVILGKDSLQEFSRSISELSTLLRALDAKRVESAMGLESTKAALETLNSQLREAGKIIKGYKSGSCLRLLLHLNSTRLQMQNLSKEIATTISSFQLVNLDMSLKLKTMINQIIDNLRSIEFRSTVAIETLAFEIENSTSQHSRNQENAMNLLQKIAEAVGARADASLVQNELALLKQEKEEMEDQKKQAEALQLAQLIQFLYSTKMVTRPQNEEISMYHQQYPFNSFICPLCNEMMTDPVAISCGHSFERKAIQDCFNRGERNCPTCGEELPSLVLTPNVVLRSSIDEWKLRDLDFKFQAAVSGINSNDHSRQNEALQNMQILIETPRYAVKVAEGGLIPKLVEFLKYKRLNTSATLKCLYYLAKHCDDHKEVIVEAGVGRRIVKQIYRGEKGLDAIAVLLELSKKETLRDKIGETEDLIPLLVSLLHNDNPDVSQKAQGTLQNLSSNTSFVIEMAEAGHFQPFVAHFNQGFSFSFFFFSLKRHAWHNTFLPLFHEPLNHYLHAGPQESRALMAADLIKMQLKENNIKDLADGQFIQSLIQMLSSNSPAHKSACLKCVKKLMVYPRIVQQLLSDSVMIRLLLGLISFVGSDSHLVQESGEILALLVGSCQHLEFQMHQGLQELQSEHNVILFMQLVFNSVPETKIQFLHLLLELSPKSHTARNLIRSDRDAIVQLFAALDGDQCEVKKWVLKLLSCISDNHPDGVPLPPSPWKETAIKTLVAILTCSLDIEERSIATAIIGQLPKDDIIIDEILKKSEALNSHS